MLFKRLKTLTPREAYACLERGDLRLVDVREPREVAKASVPGAVP